MAGGLSGEEWGLSIIAGSLGSWIYRIQCVFWPACAFVQAFRLAASPFPLTRQGSHLICPLRS